MFFGDDGFLYISVGDEGNCCSKEHATQRLDVGLWSGILRIDVDMDPTRSHPIRRQPTHLEENPAVNGAQWPQSSSANYFIPNDNPFVDPSGGNLEEFYSLGLRHPWTIHYDSFTGDIWAADVGQAAYEEVNVIEKGDNHQWGYKEGPVNGVIAKPANVIGKEVPPVFAYPRSEGQAVIGGGVYRGDKFPELFGKYLFSEQFRQVLERRQAGRTL
ncbi:MAG: PQQ-dependent sugar dehydrogenase [Silicimonas sp.]|nr:PQQ-dependent sugar dehydrogenase [Silicimonas sp.]